jgi:hypothetical protein
MAERTICCQGGFRIVAPAYLPNPNFVADVRLLVVEEISYAQTFSPPLLWNWKGEPGGTNRIVETNGKRQEQEHNCRKISVTLIVGQNV